MSAQLPIKDPQTAPAASGPADSDSVILLRRFAEATGVTFDPIVAGHAVQRAEREIPPTVARAARKRLTQAAEALGLQLLTR